MNQADVKLPNHLFVHLHLCHSLSLEIHFCFFLILSSTNWIFNYSYRFATWRQLNYAQSDNWPWQTIANQTEWAAQFSDIKLAGKGKRIERAKEKKEIMFNGWLNFKHNHILFWGSGNDDGNDDEKKEEVINFRSTLKSVIWSN